jgi:conjugal transfer/type IV secretion protein DotA/TraY
MAFDPLRTPEASDVLWQWVNTILPESMDSPYGHALATFTASLALIASLMVGFHIIVGIVSTAYSGKVLGDKYHQIWAPLRVVLGFGMMVPIAGGFSSVHQGLRDVVAPLAINLGNAPWVGYVEHIAKERDPITPYRSGGSRLAMDVLEHEVCLAVYNARRSGWLLERGGPDYAGVEKGLGIIGNPVFLWDYGATCGSFSFEKIAVGKPSEAGGEVSREQSHAFANARRLAVSDLIGSMRLEAAKYGEHFAKHNHEMTVEQAQIAVGNGVLPELLGKLKEFGAKYDAAIVQAAKAETETIASDATANMAQEAKTKGLATAGAMWLSLAQVSNLSTTLTNEAPERVKPRIEDLSKNEYIKSSIIAALDSLRNQVSGETQWSGLTANDLAAAGDEAGGVISRVIGPMTRGFMEGMAKGEPTDNAMVDIANTGQWLKFSAKSAVAAGVVINMATKNAIGKAIGAGGAAEYALGWASWGIMLTFILGVIRADIFPLVPYILITLMCVKWLGSLLEATIATPLWSFVFVRMDGQELVDQKQAAGVTMLLNLVLRPVLSILALIASYPLFNAAFGFVDETLATAYFGNTGGSIPSIDNYLIYLTISTWLMWAIGLHLFGYVGSMSDKIYPWMGVQIAGQNDGGDATAMAVSVAALADKTPQKQMAPKKEKSLDGHGAGGMPNAVAATRKQEGQRQ